MTHISAHAAVSFRSFATEPEATVAKPAAKPATHVSIQDELVSSGSAASKAKQWDSGLTAGESVHEDIAAIQARVLAKLVGGPQK